MSKKYFIFCFEEKGFDDIIKEIDLKTDKSYLMKVGWNSKLGKEIREKVLKELKKGDE